MALCHSLSTGATNHSLIKSVYFVFPLNGFRMTRFMDGLNLLWPNVAVMNKVVYFEEVLIFQIQHKLKRHLCEKREIKNLNDMTRALELTKYSIKQAKCVDCLLYPSIQYQLYKEKMSNVWGSGGVRLVASVSDSLVFGFLVLVHLPINFCCLCQVANTGYYTFKLSCSSSWNWKSN